MLMIYEIVALLHEPEPIQEARKAASRTQERGASESRDP
jgi:hypothetical protein